MRRASKATLKRKCDKLWAEITHTLSRQKCLIRGQSHGGNLNAHHLLSRSLLATRHDPRNGVCLCSLHHIFSKTLSPHGAPLAFADYLHEHHEEICKWYQVARIWKSTTVDLRNRLDALFAIHTLITLRGPAWVTKIMFMFPELTVEELAKQMQVVHKIGVANGTYEIVSQKN